MQRRYGSNLLVWMMLFHFAKRSLEVFWLPLNSPRHCRGVAESDFGMRFRMNLGSSLQIERFKETVVHLRCHKGKRFTRVVRISLIFLVYEEWNGKLIEVERV